MSRSHHYRMNARRWDLVFPVGVERYVGLLSAAPDLFTGAFAGSGPVCSFRPTPGTAKARRWARIDRREADRVLRRAFVRARTGAQP